MSFCDFVPNDPSCQVEPEPTPEPSVAPSVGGALANPYSFVGVDWHWTLWVAFFNVALPSAAYYQMGYNDTTATTARKTALALTLTRRRKLSELPRPTDRLKT